MCGQRHTFGPPAIRLAAGPGPPGARRPPGPVMRQRSVTGETARQHRQPGATGMPPNPYHHLDCTEHAQTDVTRYAMPWVLRWLWAAEQTSLSAGRETSSGQERHDLR